MKNSDDNNVDKNLSNKQKSNIFSTFLSNISSFIKL